MTPLSTKLSSRSSHLSSYPADWLVAGVFQDSPVDAELDGMLGGALTKLRESGDLTGKHLELVPMLNVAGIGAKRLLLVGLGNRSNTSRSTLHDAFAAALRSITGKRISRVIVALPERLPLDRLATTLAVGVGTIQGCYGPGIRKSEPSRFAPEEIVFYAAFEDEFLDRIRAEGTALTFAKELVNAPPCDLYPETFAARIAENPNVECEIWDEKRLRDERMGAILGVAEAASRPARLAILRYRNAGNAPTLALVGKGVTFDSGGLSLKTNDQMADMKCDMAGAAAVAAAIHAAADLGLKVNLLGIMPLVENMPGGRALKLGDVLKARNGKTIEVLNTDAEGRLILADALAYAAEKKPGHIVDLATLTGSCMMALGTQIAGVMSNNEEWSNRLIATAKRAGERLWPLPMDADFAENLKSNVADIKNVGANRYGGAILGGKFLEQFVAGIPWAHLDIAGPAWADHDSATKDAGGTGAYVRTLIELAASYSV